MKIRRALGICDNCGVFSAIADDEVTDALEIGDKARECTIVYGDGVVCRGNVVYVAYLKEIGE